jgi:methionyl-tRNA formyltransferase
VLDDRGTIACGEGAIRLLEVQRPGARALPIEEFLRGFKLPKGTRLG